MTDYSSLTVTRQKGLHGEGDVYAVLDSSGDLVLHRVVTSSPEALDSSAEYYENEAARAHESAKNYEGFVKALKAIKQHKAAEEAAEDAAKKKREHDEFKDSLARGIYNRTDCVSWWTEARGIAEFILENYTIVPKDEVSG